MAQQILIKHTTFQKKCLDPSLLLVGSYFLCFLLVGNYIFHLNTDRSKSANISLTTHITKLSRQTPMHVHDENLLSTVGCSDFYLFVNLHGFSPIGSWIRSS
jgi:hypothetical protein